MTEPVDLDRLVGVELAELAGVPRGGDHQVARRVRELVEQHERALAAVNDEPVLVWPLERAAEDAAVLLVGATDVFESPGSPERSRHAANNVLDEAERDSRPRSSGVELSQPLGWTRKPERSNIGEPMGSVAPKTVRSAVLGSLGETAELLERSQNLATLEDALAAVLDSSRGRVVFVGGEAGVGKTTLVRTFCDQRAGSARLLAGACDALFTPRPLGPLLDITRTTGGELATLVEGEARPHEVASALLRELEARSPTILVLEDVHAADEATLDVLRLVCRRVEAAPVLIIATYRDDELDRAHPLRIVLGELGPESSLTRVKIEPLSPEAVAELARPRDIDAEELYRVTGGNAFFVTEVLAGEGRIPDSIRDAVLARATRLSEPARELLDVVAIVPPQANLWLIEAVAAEAMKHLDECLSSGMLAPDQDGVAFRHELARLAVEESIPPDRLVKLHREALQALVDPPSGVPDLARLAYHAEGAGDAEAVLSSHPRPPSGLPR